MVVFKLVDDVAKGLDGEEIMYAGTGKDLLATRTVSPRVLWSSNSSGVIRC
jgi:hypothetical protein